MGSDNGARHRAPAWCRARCGWVVLLGAFPSLGLASTDAGLPPDGSVVTPLAGSPLDGGRGAWDHEAGAAEPEALPPVLEHWAFKPIVEPEVPSVDTLDWPYGAIDAFVLAALEARGLAPSEQAPPHTLLRRVHLDLVGLLPTPEEQAHFSESDPDAGYEAVVERLLASKHFGERWGRHWLDGARYADSDGYAHDSPRSLWPYRDYVISAFNDDHPFDQFIVEQLAGDLLPSPTIRELSAVAFHRNTMTNTEGGIDLEEFRVEAVKDRVNTTAKVFLGLTLECAQCHNHLYEPITQREYYQFYSFFNDADEVARPAAFDERTIELLSFEQREEPRPAFVQLRGDFLAAGELVAPDVPAILPPLSASGRPNRLDLSRWLTSPENPLTARVTVNRIWQTLFGLGLVQTEDDFGLRGDVPSHPELLDWLAFRFREDGWSVKSLVRQIVTSATYRQSSALRPSVEDPQNRLLARQRRLRVEAEIIRDVSLQAAGLLELRLGGPSVFPPIPQGVVDSGHGGRDWPLSKGVDRYRRGIYTFFYRTVPYPSLVVFDAPDAQAATTRRERSNTALQALTLLNEEAFDEAALAMGTSLTELEADDATRLEAACRRTLSRAPTPEEASILMGLLEEERTRPADGDGFEAYGLDPPVLAEASAWSSVARVLLNLDEFITRE